MKVEIILQLHGYKMITMAASVPYDPYVVKIRQLERQLQQQAQMIAQLQKLAGLESDKKGEEKDSEAK